MPRKRVTPEQDAFILKNYASMSKEAIGEALGLAKGTVITRYHYLTETPTRRSRRITAEQDALILANFNRMTKKELGMVVGLPENTVFSRYRDLMLGKREYSNGVRLSRTYAEPSLPKLKFLEKNDG